MVLGPLMLAESRQSCHLPSEELALGEIQLGSLQCPGSDSDLCVGSVAE